MVLCPVVNSLRMLELLGQVCLVVVRFALFNLACRVRLSNYWICLLVWLFVSGLIVLVWSALFQAVLFSLVWSVLAGLFWSISFGLYCSGLFSPVPSWQVLFWLVFHIDPVVLEPLSYHMFCSAQVRSTLSFSHSFGSSFCLGLLWSKLFSSVWFGLFWLVCSGLVPLVCTALVFSRLCPAGRFCPGLFFRVSPFVLDPIFSDMFCSALVWSTLSFSH